jgi:predicted nuclease of predicted toxin-antitoxin system
MRLLLDMNLPPAVAETLRSGGHDVVHGRDLGLAGVPDTDLFARASAEQRILVTFDLDFGDIAGSSGEGATGVVLLRLRSPRRAVMIERIITALRVSADALARGAVVLVEDARIRIRELP